MDWTELSREMDRLNVVWDSPSPDCMGSMPLGNGDLSANVWVEPSGDLLLYVGKNDTFDANCRLLKLCRLRVRLSPAPAQAPFEQTHLPAEGMVRVRWADTTLRVWVDANHPAVRIEIESPTPRQIEARLEVWRNAPRALEGQEVHSAYGLSGQGKPIVQQPDVIAPAADGDWLQWHHRVGPENIYRTLMELQSLADFIPRHHDPLTGRTFGGRITGTGLNRIDPNTLRSTAPLRQCAIALCALTRQTPAVADWESELDHLSQALPAAVDARPAHLAWWASFWQRSFIFVSGDAAADTVSRAYQLQRFMAAGASRGTYPIKFNGSLFTVEGIDKQVLADKRHDADFRLWGGHYWHQNTRLPYWAMLAAGDYDLMAPFFRLYLDQLPLAIHRVHAYSGHDGALFPETMTIFGTYAGDDYGWDRSALKPGDSPNQNIRLHICGALETAAIMLDYVRHGEDRAFAAGPLVRFTDAVLTFYFEHYGRDGQQRIRLEPSQALETWQKTVNPLPDLCGLRYALEGLLADEALGTPEQRQRWRQWLAAVPPLTVVSLGRRRELMAEQMASHQHRINATDGSPASGEDSLPVLMPAQEVHGKISNWENPELYAVFPYRVYQVGKPEVETGRNSYLTRHELVPLPSWLKEAFGGIYYGWSQDDAHAALLGLGQEAAKGVSERLSRHHPQSRFPAMWGPNCDWIPDQCHGSVGMIALQRMLVQEVGDTLHLMPAWPMKWSARFRLHTTGQRAVEGEIRDGKMIHLDAPGWPADKIIIHPAQ